MINLETFCGRASGTSAVLSRVQSLDISKGEGAAGCGFSRAPDGRAYAPHRADMIFVRRFPALESLLSLFAILLSPAFYLGAVAGRISSAASPRTSGHVPRIALIPAGAFVDRALDARAARDKSPICVSVSTTATDRVVPKTGQSSGGLRRMFDALRLPSLGFFGIAGFTRTTLREALGNMSVLAGFACKVRRLAGDLGRFAFWNSSHTFTLIEAT